MEASPLRYPGGKAFLYPLIVDVLRRNRLERQPYVEPFAGGCGLALRLLFGGHVSDIYINDLDRAIWAFWFAVLNETEALVELVRSAPISVKEWDRQKDVYAAQRVDRPVELGFAAFFLNRTNRSGIIQRAGMIGGRAQKGPYTLGCRFNREGLLRRIRRIAKYRSQIHLYRRDANSLVDELEDVLPRRTFYYVDPPYVNGGDRLYRNWLDECGHSSLAERLCQIKSPWVVTYDNAEWVRRLYVGRRQCELDVSYSVKERRRATELLIASKGLRLPDYVRERQLPVAKGCGRSKGDSKELRYM